MTTSNGSRKMAKAPGKSHRKGISLMQLAERFPNEDAAREWFESIAWGDGEIACLKCGSENAYRVKSGKPQPYRCRDCRSYFSLKTNTALAGSNLTLRQWAYGIYLVVTNLKSVSSMKLHRDLGVTQKTAWFMLHRIRETWGWWQRRGVLRPGRGGRDLRRRTGTEQARIQEAQGGPGSGGEDSGGGSQGSEDGTGCRTGD